MTVQMYDSDELASAREALAALVEALPDGTVLLGGWAVYHLVGHSYEREHGAPYLGSRDIDVGFHVDPSWTDDELRSSAFARAIEVARSMGYGPMGSFRFCRFIRRSDGRALTEEESRRVPSHDLFQLYLDMMVDRIHPRQAEVLGPRAMDEPILARVFEEGLTQGVLIGGSKVPVPPPHLLLAMKLRSVPNRQREDKAIKDACDVYALLWHSPGGIGRVLAPVRGEYPAECRSGLAAITDDVAGRAAAHLGVDVGTFMDVVGQLG